LFLGIGIKDKNLLRYKMNNQIDKTDVPGDSQISTALVNVYYRDAHRFSTIYKERSALQIWLAHATSAPAWINFLMAVRNKVVSLLGLKDLGNFADKLNEKSAEEYRVGDRIGIFTLLFLSENEVILGDSDKHLDVKISIFKESKADENSNLVTISTLVHVHNLLGKVYMLFVAPIHKMIVPATIRRAEFKVTSKKS